jgi:[amino group carrier protein]-lysine/ornithine hydrolase
MNAAELLEAMVRIPSPTGDEEAIVSFLRQQAAADGFRVLEDPVGNFVAEAGRGTRLLLFVGHVDTVPGQIPVRRENGTLWGRGTVDAKGPLAAFYLAARRHLDNPNLRIRIVGAIDEEGHSRGAQAVPADLRPEWVLIGEPSGAHGVTVGYKGILRGAFRVERPRSHGAHREPSAVEAAVQFWQGLAARYRFDDHYDTIQGRLDSLNTTSDGLVDRVEGRFNLRLPPNVDPHALEAELVEASRENDVEVEIDERMRGAQASKRTPLVAAFLAAIRGHGGEPRVKRKTGTADFNLFAHRHPNIPIAAYGPGDAALDHTPHEHLELREFEAAIDVLDAVLRRLAAP